MFSRFFNLRTLDTATGLVKRATFREKIAWLVAGCPVRSKRVVDRFVAKKHALEVKEHLDACATLKSNTFSLPSS